MAVLVSHAMHRFPSSTPDVVYSPYTLRGESTASQGRKEAGESALSRSMRYADPWLYGSVRASPGLLLAPAFVLCSCPEYVNGTKRASKKGPGTCKKCKGTRLPLGATDTKFGTVRCYPTSHAMAAVPPLRAGTVRVASTSRPSILPSADPYDLMRRSRLAVAEPTEGIREGRASGHPNRARSSSPNKEARSKAVKRETYTSPNGRRSILECSINPYELMSSEEITKSKESSITFVNGQRIRVKPQSSDNDYEDVQLQRSPSKSVTKSGSKPSQSRVGGVQLKTSTRRGSTTTPTSSPKNQLNEKCSDPTLTRFKSILKKRSNFADTDSDSPQSSPPTQTNLKSHFYVPIPSPIRKKVQFLVENVSNYENVSNGGIPAFHDNVTRHIIIASDDNKERQTVESECESLGANKREISSKVGREDETNVSELNVEEEDVFEDALEEQEQKNEEKQDTTKDKTEKDAKKPRKLQRSHSERYNNGPKNVSFHDTMALRSRKRSDSRIIFAETDLERLDGITPRTRKISPSKPRPSTPPPPPPTQENSVEKEPINPCEIIPTKLEQREEKNNTNEGNNLTLTPVKILEKREETLSVETPTGIPNILEQSKDRSLEQKALERLDRCLNTPIEPTPPSAPPRKRSNNKQPQLQILKSPEIQTVKIQSPFEDTSCFTINENLNKTIVQINTPPTVHKLQIKNEFPDTVNVQTVSVLDNPHRKTSILINGDDCYSTVNVNDDIPLYQSSVVVNDVKEHIENPSSTPAKKSSLIYITGSFISVEPEEKTSFIQKSSPDIDSNKTEPVIVENKKSVEINNVLKKDISSSELLKELLSDPVEAVRRNLVPHVCGKSDMSRRPRDKKFAKYPSLLTGNIFLETTEDVCSSLEDSFTQMKQYEAIGDDVGSEHSSSTQYELMDPGSDCYTDHSNRSSVTEEELANRTKFYELLADANHVEVSEIEDHHYESIKMNSDPIYEEIQVPPPLPSNPPPMSLLDDLKLDKEYTTRSIFEGASKYDILSYLVDAKERGVVQEDGYTYPFPNNNNTINEEETKEPYNRISHMSSVSDSSEDNSLIISGALIDEKATSQKPAEVERNDSGVGSETSKSSLSKYRIKQETNIACEDCDDTIDSKTENDPLICRKCVKKRSERKEIITEIVETEEKYSKDLQIILEEFYQPMLVAGLLTPEQLSAIFLNVEELLENSQALAERLRDAVEIALEQGDDDLLTVNIGKLFLEAAPMLHAFETYCIRQGAASLLLASLEKEKELLRIFLKVSQMENTMLRRMNLNSFLMVPVQRVTKYPLLLARLHKVTPLHHDTRDQLKESQHKIELHLNHMNSETKDVPSKLWRRIGSSSGRRASTEMDLVNIKLRKIAVDVLEWNHDEAKFALEGKLLFTQPTDNNWRKGRTIKLTPVNALLVVNGKATSNSKTNSEENGLTFSRNSGIREAALLLVRDKNGRYSLLREPLYLDRCVIASDPAWQCYFEVQEVLGKDTFIFKAEDEEQTHIWYKQLQIHAQGMGAWRKRRNALANIMINGMGLRS